MKQDLDLCCIVNLRCDRCFHVVSAGVLSVLWENTYDILWEQKIVYCGPSAQFNSHGVDFKCNSVIVKERERESKCEKQTLPQSALCQLSST